MRRERELFYYEKYGNEQGCYVPNLDQRNEVVEAYKPMVKEKLEMLIAIDADDEEEEKDPVLASLYEQFDEERNEKKPYQGTIVDAYYETEVDPKMILIVGLGKNVRGNMQYILNVLNKSDLYKGFKIYVRTSKETNTIVKNFIKENQWKRTETVLNTKQYDRYMETAGYLIAESFFSISWMKKPGQKYINIWHGTPLKKLGLAKNTEQSAHRNGATQKNFIDADYLLYPNVYTKEKMLESYKITSLVSGRVYMGGYPRTGGMLDAAEHTDEETARKLAPNGETIYAYMPTFKDWLPMETVVEQSKELLDYLDANLTNQQIMYVNLHHKVSDSIDYSAYTHVKKFPSDVDSYKLLAYTNALLTDYSSVFFDYLALRRQIILYIPDYDVYSQMRGVYMDIRELPFDKVNTKEEVIEALNKGKTYDDEKAVAEFCPYDTVKNAENVCSVLIGKNKNTEELPKDGKKNVMFYTEKCQPGFATEMLYEIAEKMDYDCYNVYFSGNKKKVASRKSMAYPLFDNYPAIGINDVLHFSSMGKAVRYLYQEEEMSFDEAIECLRYDYTLMNKMMYGRAKFDTVVIYDTDNPDILISLAEMGTRIILNMPCDVIGKIVAEDKVFMDSVIFAANFADTILVESKNMKRIAKMYFEPYLVKKMKVASNADDFINLTFGKKSTVS